MADPPARQGAVSSTGAPPRRSWGDGPRGYLDTPVPHVSLLGSAAARPPLLVLGTLSFRLRGAGIGRAVIGCLSWVGLAYTVKWAWAPLVDRVALPWITRRLGRRRSWLICSQLVIAAGL